MAYDNYSNIQHTTTPYTNTTYNNNNTDTSVNIPTFYHRDPFLQGAIWLSRNTSIIFDDLYIDYEDIARENRLEISRILEEIKAIIPSSSVYIIDELNMKVRFSYEGLGQRFRDCQQRIRSVIEVRMCIYYHLMCILICLPCATMPANCVRVVMAVVYTVLILTLCMHSPLPRCLQATPRPCDTSSRACLWRGRCLHEGNRCYTRPILMHI